MNKNGLVVLTIFAATVVAAGAGLQSGGGESFIDVRGYILPASQVTTVAGTIMRLDTKTGALSHIRGDATSRGSSATWGPSVSPVQGSSGYLEIQRPLEGDLDGVFLVDVRKGTTWVLRWRGNRNGSWALVESTP